MKTLLIKLLPCAALALALLALPARAQRVTDLPPGNTIGDTDLFLDVQGYTGSGTGTTTKVSGAQLKAYLPATLTLPWGSITGTPTTLAGYGITDPVVLTTGAYANPAWITSLPYSKLTGVPTLGSLSSVTPTGTPGSATYLQYNGTNYVWATPPGNATSGASLLYGNGSGGFSNATVGSGLSFSGGTLSATNTGALTSLTAGTGLTGGTITGTGTITVAYGTTSGTSAQGNDSRITGALQASALGSGVGTALALVPNSPGGLIAVDTGTRVPVTIPATALHAPTGSVVICIGDSITAGYPVVALGTSPAIQTGYTGPGYCYPQWLSLQPYFSGVPVYDFGVGGTRSNSGASVLGTASNNGTEYINGVAVTGYGAVTASAESLYSSTGITYYLNWFGINDQAGSVTPSVFLSNMDGMYTTEHSLGANVKVVSFTSTQSNVASVFAASTGDTVRAYNQLLYGAYGAAWDYLADINTVFSQSADITVADGYMNSDDVHYLSLGYKQISDEVWRVISSGLQGIQPQGLYYGQGKWLYSATGFVTMDTTTGKLYNGGRPGASNEQVVFDPTAETAANANGGVTANFNVTQLLDSGGSTAETWGARTLNQGGAVEASWATAGQFQVAGMVCGLPNTGTGNQAGAQLVLSNGLGLGTVVLPMLIENPTGTTTGGTPQTRSIDMSIWPDGGVYIGSGTTTDPGAHGLQITGPLTVVSTSASASFTLTQGTNFFTGSTASQTGTLPVPTTAGQKVFIKNNSSVSLTVGSASSSQIIAAGATTASSSITLSSGADATFYSDGTYWNQL